MKKITLNWLVSLLAEKYTEYPADKLAAFAEAFFDSIKEGLKADGVVRIKSFGAFTLENGKISFVPETAFADAVNLPFAYFEPVPVDADIEETISAIKSEQIATDPEKEPATVSTDTAAVPEEDSEPEDVSVPEEAPVPEVQEITVPDEKDISVVTDKPEPEVIYIEEPARFPWFWVFLALFFGAGLGYIIGSNFPYYDRWVEGVKTTEETDVEIVVESENDTIIQVDSDTISTIASIESQPVKETAAVVYDTVAPRKFLTTMSRKHYGAPEFWVYIYLENENHIGHPDRIPASTVLVIPPAAKYDIDPENPESIAAAKKVAANIRKKYK